MTKLICSECGVEVFLCDHCTESFIESIKIYCAFKSEKHYCYDDFVKIGIEPPKLKIICFFLVLEDLLILQEQFSIKKVLVIIQMVDYLIYQK